MMDKALHVRTDHAQVNLGLAVEEVISPDALVAVLYAGAPGYYSQRPLVDLLGKNDRHIATGPPGIDLDGEPQSFHPGHNKFDATYSIFEPEPDVIVGSPRDASADQLLSWGYGQLRTADQNVLWVRSIGAKVKWGRLGACP